MAEGRAGLGARRGGGREAERYTACERGGAEEEEAGGGGARAVISLQRLLDLAYAYSGSTYYGGARAVISLQRLLDLATHARDSADGGTLELGHLVG